MLHSKEDSTSTIPPDEVPFLDNPTNEISIVYTGISLETPIPDESSIATTPIDHDIHDVLCQSFSEISVSDSFVLHSESSISEPLSSAEALQ